MREMGFITLHPGVLGVFVQNEHVGVIRQTEEGHRFVPMKARKPMDSDSLRAVANKIDMMEKKDG